MTMRKIEFNKESTKKRIITHIIKNGASSRKEIAMSLGLTTATLTIASAALIEDGIIVEGGTIEDGKVGRKQRIIDVKDNLWYAIGFDVTNNKLRVTVLNIKADIVEEREWLYPKLTEELLHQAIGYMEELLLRYKEKKILGVGLLMQGYVEDDLCHTLPIKDIKARITERFTLDVFMMNNVKGLALTEYYFGNTAKNFLLIKYGPGVGGVIVVEGEIVKGYRNRAGEIGHVKWNHASNGVCEICGKRGCLESQVRFRTILEKIDPNIKEDLVDFDVIMKASYEDDFSALKSALDTLAEATSVFIDILDPDQIFLAGEIFTEDFLYDHFVKNLKKQVAIESDRIKLISDYRLKRKKAAGVIVLNEYFGKGDKLG